MLSEVTAPLVLNGHRFQIGRQVVMGARGQHLRRLYMIDRQPVSKAIYEAKKAEAYAAQNSGEGT